MACITSAATVNRGRAARRGFTIIELLVVIAVIGLLAAILIPGLDQARESVLCAQCQSNLHGLSQGLHIWASAYNDEKMPSAYEWQDVLVRDGVILSGRHFLCPKKDKLEAEPDPAGMDQVHLKIYSGSSYLYSLYLFDGNSNVRREGETKERVRIWVEDLKSGQDWGNGPDIYLDIQKAGRMHCTVLSLGGHSPGYTHDLYRGNTLLLQNVKTKIGVELDLLVGGGPGNYGMNNQVLPVPRADQLLLLDYKFSVADVDRKGGSDDDLSHTLPLRHFGKVNIVTCDGGVRLVTPLELNRVKGIWRTVP